jgi:hypothetical protein
MGRLGLFDRKPHGSGGDQQLALGGDQALVAVGAVAVSQSGDPASCPVGQYGAVEALADLPVNFICRPYRGLSVQDVPVALDEATLCDWLAARPVYRRTDLIVARREGRLAVVRVAREEGEGVLVPVAGLRYVAGPDEVAFVRASQADTANATQLAQAAADSGVRARVYVVQGLYEHVNVIVQPTPLDVRVVEVVPPHPPKLLDMARRVVAFDEGLPPVALRSDLIDLHALLAAAPEGRHLLPCRCAGLDAAADFLDDAPPQMADWTLIGCERSRQIHEALYGQDPPRRIDLCPLAQRPDDGTPTLTKCCLREAGLERRGASVVVAWGGGLDDVRAALRLLTGVGDAPS